MLVLGNGAIHRESVGKVVHYIKMFVIDNLSADTLDKIVHKHIDKDTVIVSDGSSWHINFKGHEQHVKSNVDSGVKTHLPWVHVVIGRYRNGIATIHGEVDKHFLQLYLNNSVGNSTKGFSGIHAPPNMTCLIGWLRLPPFTTSNGETTTHWMMKLFKIY